jgi:hypothetical protein
LGAVCYNAQQKSVVNTRDLEFTIFKK